MKATVAVSFTRRDGLTVSRTVDLSSSDLYGREGVGKFKTRVKRATTSAVNAVLGPLDPPAKT